MLYFFLIFLECSITMAMFAVLYQLLTPLLSKHYTARTLYYGWLVVIVGFIIPFRPRLNFGLIHVPLVIQQVNDSSGCSPLLLVAIIWICGVVAVFAYHLFMHYRFINAVNRWEKRLETQEILETLENELKETGVVADVFIYQCPFISSPLLIGFRQPKILLPNMELSQDELSMIIRHELIHYRRKDNWAKFIILLATALHWYNPVIWFLSKAIFLQCEISCDNETMINADMEQRQQYSETLIGVIRQAKLKTVFASNFYCSKQNLKNRIVSIMDISVKKFSVAMITVIALFIIATGTLISHTQTTSQPNGVQYNFNNDQVFDYHFD